MAGTFTIGEKKVRPGTYYRYENAGGVETVGAINGIAAVLLRSNWGPLNKVFEMDITMQNNVADYYGDDPHTQVIKEAFKGGATTVKVVRVGGADGTNAKVELLNEEDGKAVVLEATYPGERAFTVSVRTNLITEARECIVYDGTQIFEKVSFAAGGNEAESLIAAFAKSKNFAAVKGDAPTGILKSVTQQEMTGGKNPDVQTEHYDVGMNALERTTWNCLCCDTDETAVHLLMQNFIEQSYQTGHLGMGVVAGLSKQDLDERMTTAASYNDEKCVYLLNGWNSSDGTVYEGYLAAARLCGMIAAFEANTSLTHTVITNAVSLTEDLTNGEITKAEQRGCVVLSLNDDDQVWIDSAINTLVTPDATQDEGWKKIRRTKTRFELMSRVNGTTDKLIGKVNNDVDGRSSVIATAQKVVNTMIAEKKLMDTSTVYEDSANPPEGDSAWFILAIDDIDSIEKCYLTYRFRFSQNS